MMSVNNSRGKKRPLQQGRWVIHTVVIGLVVLIAIGSLLTVGVIDDKSSHSFNPFQLISNLVHRSGGNSRSIAQQVATSTEVVGQQTAPPTKINPLQIAKSANINLSQTSTSTNINPSNVTGYHVVGKQILDNHGNVYIPYGVHLIGLDNPNWRTYPGTEHLNQGEVNAAKQIWHSNIIALQLNSAAMFAASPYESHYLAKVDQIVSWANKQDMNVLIILQYEESTYQTLPTQDTIKFWDFISKHFVNNSRVFFDLFNEPHDPNNRPDDAAMWSIWRNGGTINNVTYVGMQQLVDTIRHNRNQNLIFAPGLAWENDIILLRKYLLTGSNIAYAVHLYIQPKDPKNPQATWDYYYGRILRAGNFPVVVDEWSDSQAPKCLKNARAVVPQMLTYLRQQKLGLIVWGLFPGILIRGWDYTKPTAYDQPNYSCNEPWPSYDPNAQGPGRLVLGFFKTQNP